MARIEAATGWEALGLIPFFPEARLLPAEDALALDGPRPAKLEARIRIAVPILPHIANFDELDPLDAEPDVELVRVRPGTTLPGDAALVLLLGSKSTIADLAALRDAGFDIDIAAHVRRGGHVLGLCGGFQMLGRRIDDPAGIEGKAGAVAGLALLDVAKILTNDKSLRSVTGMSADGKPFKGYEMHVGETTGPDALCPFATLSDGRSDGAVSPSGRVSGTYVHGLFADDIQRRAWLERLGGSAAGFDYEAGVDQTHDFRC